MIKIFTIPIINGSIGLAVVSIYMLWLLGKSQSITELTLEVKMYAIFTLALSIMFLICGITLRVLKRNAPK